MDTLAEVSRKQHILRDVARPHRAVKLRTHEAHASVLEGIFARGDRRLADVLERAFRRGARFDSWDDQLKLAVWEEAFSHYGIDRSRYLGTLPITARLPWDHIDVGLEEGFLAKEYRKALQSRLSPPCGKVAGMFVHHTNLEDARADERRLVCYDCGVACDMTLMREERFAFLDKLGAHKRSLPVIPPGVDEEEAPVRAARVPQGRKGIRYRFHFEKTGPTALLGHLDVVRELPRVLRRVGAPMVYTNGFHPKPDMSFAPALSLGVISLGEYVDVRLDQELDPAALADLVQAMTAASPMGLVFRGAARLGPEDPPLSKVIAGARYLLVLARSAVGEAPAEAWLADRCGAAMEASELPIRREIQGLAKKVDVRAYLTRAEVAGPEALAALGRAGLAGDLVAIDVDVDIRGTGSVKSSEIAAVIAGEGGVAPPHRAIRIELFARDAAEAASGARVCPLDLARVRAACVSPEPAPTDPRVTPRSEVATAAGVLGPLDPA
jgi:radical SAM-linked protein